MLPRSERHTRTRAVYLDRVTRVDAASDFFGEPHVPRRAITMGIATILEVRLSLHLYKPSLRQSGNPVCISYRRLEMPQGMQHGGCVLHSCQMGLPMQGRV